MKDLVETVIGQVMRQNATYPGQAAATATRMPNAPAHRIQQLSPAGEHHAAIASERDPLWKASRQFEALFVEQMLSSMRKAIPDSGLMKKGFAQDVSTSMMDQAVADSIGKQGRMGIATSLYRQLSNVYTAGTQEAQQGPKQEQIQANAQNGDTQGTPLIEARVKIEGVQHGTH